MSFHRTVKIGDKFIGEGQPVFIVVELGVCHEQNLDVAKHFVEMAKKAGADAVKVEAFQADQFVMDRSLKHAYGTTEGLIEENYYKLLKRLELTFDQIREIKKKADDVGILFFSTVHDKKDVEFFDDLGVAAYKIASADLTHRPLIECLCGKQVPVFMDTGAAYLEEIDKSVRVFENEGFQDLILMHNPSGYPAPAEKTDLQIIPTLQKIYELPVGLSCHTPGMDMVVASVALGAKVIEKPITRDNTIRGPEHIFAFRDIEAEEYVYKVRNTEICMGGNRRISIPSTAHARAKRRGIYAKSDLPKGHKLTEDDLLYRVPNKGIPSEFYQDLLNKTLKRDYKAKEAFQRKDIDD